VQELQLYLDIHKEADDEQEYQRLQTISKLLWLSVFARLMPVANANPITNFLMYATRAVGNSCVVQNSMGQKKPFLLSNDASTMLTASGFFHEFAAHITSIGPRLWKNSLAIYLVP